MLIVDLSICRRFKVELTVIDIVDVAQLVLALIFAVAFVVDERYVVFLDVCIVHLDVPVGVAVITAPADIVGVPARLPFEMLLRFQIGIGMLDVADEILSIAF